MPASSCWNSRRYPRAPKTASRFRACWCSRGDDKQPAGRYLSPVLTLEKPQAAELPDVFTRWFSARGWVARAHQLELLAKARPARRGQDAGGFLAHAGGVKHDPPARSVGSLPPWGGWGRGVEVFGRQRRPH